MSISGISQKIGSIQPIIQPQDTPGLKQSGSEKGQGSFADAFVDALKEVNHMQIDADKQIENLILGKGGVSTHDAMIALEKADVAFQLMNQIRSKIVMAYEQVLRTQI